MINQELDLIFIGSTKCIFPDDFLSKVKPIGVVKRERLRHQTFLNLYSEYINTKDFILIGVDSAKSLVGDYSAIEVFSYMDFTQIGEYFGKLGSLTKYSEVLKDVIQFFYKIVGKRILLCIENNSIGASVIENLENDEEFDYSQFIYSPNPEKYVGIHTGTRSKDTMISLLYDYLIEDTNRIKSSDLINQLHVIERRVNGSISAQSGKHDDLFMAASLCAYGRRLSAFDIEPMLDYGSDKKRIQQESFMKDVISMVTVANSREDPLVYNAEEGGFEYVTDDKRNEIINTDDDMLFVLF